MIRRFLRAHGELSFLFALGALAQVELWLDSEWSENRYELAPIALVMTALLLLRLRAPLLTLLLELAALELATAVNTVPTNDPMGVILPVAVALYSTGAHTRGRVFAIGSLVVLVAIVGAMVQDGSSLNVSGFLFFGFFIGAPFVGGAVIRIRRERERLLVSERDEKARTAVAEERARIARELHDVVAHGVSVIVLQARGGRRVLDEDPAEAREAFDSARPPASRPSPRCGGCSGSSARTMRSWRSRRNQPSRSSTDSSRRSARPGCPSRFRSRASPSSSRPESISLLSDRPGGAHECASTRRPGPCARPRSLRRGRAGARDHRRRSRLGERLRLGERCRRARARRDAGARRGLRRRAECGLAR